MSDQTMYGLVVTKQPKLNEMVDCLQYRTNIPKPRNPSKDEVIIKVLSAGLNIDDIHFTEGTFFGIISSVPKNTSEEKPKSPGLECVGIIEELGANVKGFQVGDIVLSCSPTIRGVRFGSWAEYTIVPKSAIIKKPEHLSNHQALASLTSGLVAATIANLIHKEISQGDATVVVVGATGSIGSIAVQILKGQGKCKNIVAICSSSSAENAKSYGATLVIPYDKYPEWGEHEMIKGKANAVLDFVGGTETERKGRSCLKSVGRFATAVGPVQYVGDRKLSTWEFLKFATSLAWKTSKNLYSSHKYNIADFSGMKKEDWLALMDEVGGITCTIDRVVNVDDLPAVQQAIQHVSSHHAKGKLIIDVAKA